MKRTQIVSIAAFCLLTTAAMAGSDDMTVQTWTGSCVKTMTTNHFELAPGESARIEVDLTGCSAAELGSILYFGYKTTKTSSKHLRSRDRVKLTLRDEAGGQYMESMGGSLFTDIESPSMCVVTAQNMGRKPVTVRLRSSIVIEQ